MILLSVKGPMDAARAVLPVCDLVRRRHGTVLVLHIHEVEPGENRRVVRQHEPDDPCIADLVVHTLARVGVSARAVTVVAPYGQLPETIAGVAAGVGAAVVVVGDETPPWAGDTGLCGAIRTLIEPSVEFVAVHH